MAAERDLNPVDIRHHLDVNKQLGQLTINVAAVNYAFQFVSMEATLRNFPQGFRGPPVYAVQGKVFHHLSDINVNNDVQRFGPIYFLTPDAAVQQRLQNNFDALNGRLVRDLEQLMRNVNPLRPGLPPFKRKIWPGVEAINQNRINGVNVADIPNVALELISARGRNNRPYDLPAINENSSPPNLRIYVRNEPRAFRNLHYTNEIVEPMTFPLIFPNGEAGWHFNIPCNEYSVHYWRQRYRSIYRITTCACLDVISSCVPKSRYDITAVISLAGGRVRGIYRITTCACLDGLAWVLQIQQTDITTSRVTVLYSALEEEYKGIYRITTCAMPGCALALVGPCPPE
ncbi:hypothetical protein NQ317_004750 [Molorchus minor]|uniref:Helitron helicase-like domain-containing protein n=1 Tax=Molorchus minor TaxID=1323400 RepID=A0ABQ9JEP4_9CUCU|nr:hypothetical protein NQ317_004750 [Molorchus minor]